jgi:hypothetical protein
MAHDPTSGQAISGDSFRHYRLYLQHLKALMF